MKILIRKQWIIEEIIELDDNLTRDQVEAWLNSNTGDYANNGDVKAKWDSTTAFVNDEDEPIVAIFTP